MSVRTWHVECVCSCSFLLVHLFAFVVLFLVLSFAASLLLVTRFRELQKKKVVKCPSVQFCDFSMVLKIINVVVHKSLNLVFRMKWELWEWLHLSYGIHAVPVLVWLTRNHTTTSFLISTVQYVTGPLRLSIRVNSLSWGASFKLVFNPGCARNRLSAGLRQHPLEELTALPQTP